MTRQLQIGITLIALVALSYLSVDIFYRVVLLNFSGQLTGGMVSVGPAAGKKTVQEAVANIQEITNRKLFGEPAPEPVAEEKVEAVEVLAPTTLKVSLLGTIAGDPGRARAIIMDNTNRTQNLYRVDDSIQDAVIRKILRGKVVLRVGNRDEILTMSEDKAAAGSSSRGSVSAGDGDSAAEEPGEPAPAGEGTEIALQMDEIKESISDLNQILSQVRIRPFFRRGKAEGMIVSQIKEDSLFSKFGIMNGDIIRTVNGKSIKSPEDAITLYKDLEAGSQVSVEVTRNGQNQTLTYTIK